MADRKTPPSSTRSLSSEGIHRFQMGYASALAWVLFFIILVLSLLVFRSFGRMVYYEEEGS